MRSFMCGCGRKYLLSDVNRCPQCNKDLTSHTDDQCRKHLTRCSGSISPRLYSERKRGRPSKKEVEIVHSEFKKHCRNCGTPHCVGCDEGICDNWSPMTIERCPFCGRMPIQVTVDGTSAIICDECGVKMIDDDLNKLITRWNRC